jgi:cardiolipin synthase
MNLSSLPNLICVLRILLAVPVVWTLVHGLFGWTLLLFVIAAISDGLDGFLAKRFDWTSEAGKVLDPVADKLLLVSVFVTLTLLGMVPLWLAATVVARDLLIGIGAAVYKWRFGPIDGRPTQPSKLNTVVQICYVICVVANAATPAVVPDAWVMALGATVFVTTFVSGADYTMTYIRKAQRVARARRVAQST